jgi:hypothetical protein
MEPVHGTPFSPWEEGAPKGRMRGPLMATGRGLSPVPPG